MKVQLGTVRDLENKVTRCHVTCHVCTEHQRTNASRSITVPYPSDVDSIETKCDIMLLVEPLAAAMGPQMTG